MRRTTATRRMLSPAHSRCTCHETTRCAWLTLRAQDVDKARGDIRRIAARAKRVLPLALGESAYERGRPSHVVARDAPAHQFLVQAVVVELDESAASRR